MFGLLFLVTLAVLVHPVLWLLLGCLLANVFTCNITALHLIGKSWFCHCWLLFLSAQKTCVLWHVGSSSQPEMEHALCSVFECPNHWAVREVPSPKIKAFKDRCLIENLAETRTDHKHGSPLLSVLRLRGGKGAAERDPVSCPDPNTCEVRMGCVLFRMFYSINSS